MDSKNERLEILKEKHHFKRYFQHTKKRFLERYGISFGKYDYLELVEQIRDKTLQTSLCYNRHMVYFQGRVYVVIYKNGLIRTVYPQEFPITKRKKQLFLKQIEERHGLRD